MTTNYLSPVFNEQTFDSSGNPLVGGQLETYVAGTSTPLASYTTQNGTTPQANPIILNSRGEPTNPIWLGAGQLYKFILKDAVGTLIRTIDNVGGVNDSSLSVSEWAASGFTPTYISAVSFSVSGDQTGTFEAGRRTRSTNSGGTIYSTIASSSYSSGTGLTTVTVRNDSGTLDAGLSVIDVGILTAVNPSTPNSQAVRQAMGFGYGSDIASAATLDLTTRSGNIVRITGTTTTTAVTLANGDQVWCYAVAAWPLTYNVTTMPIPGGSSFTCSAGDIVKFTKDGNGTISIEIYKKDGTSVAANSPIQQISASVGSNALTISASALSLDFRSTTLGSGAVTRVSGTPANLVISSGSTLGSTNAVQSDIAVLAINNAGTIELAAVNLAGGVDLSETGLVSTTAEGGAGAADSINTIYSTTARSNVAYRVIGVIRSTQATAGTWATNPSLVQGIGGMTYNMIPFASLISVNTANGYGSTNTKIRRFATTLINRGTDITYADSATLGASFTINVPGIYAISYSENFSAIGVLGLSLNTTQPTTNIYSITTADILSMGSSPAGNFPGVAQVTRAFAAGDVIRPHTDGSAVGAFSIFFTIQRVG